MINFEKKKENSLFSIHNPVSIKLLTRLRLQLSHLNEHKCTQDFEVKLVLYAHAMQKSKVTNTSSCVAIFILLKGHNCSIILIKLTLLFSNKVRKTK